MLSQLDKFFFGYHKSGKTRFSVRETRNFRIYLYEVGRNEVSRKLAVSVFRDDADGDYRKKNELNFEKNEVVSQTIQTNGSG